MKLFFLSLIVALAMTSASAQIYGTAAAMQNCSYVFTYNQGTVVFPQWQPSANGAIISTNQFGSIYQVTVKWISGTVGTLSFYDGTTLKASANVVVTTVPLQPSANNKQACHLTPILLDALQGNTGGYVRWYTASSGGTYFHQGTTYTTPALSATTNYYVTTYDLCTSLESPRKTITVSIAAPQTPTSASGVRAFANTPVQLSVGSVAGATAYRWYQQATGGTAILGEPLSTMTITVTNPATYYVSSMINSCESAGRISVAATVEPNPAITASEDRIVMGKPVTLDGSDGYATYVWRSESGTVLGTSPTLSVNTPGSYTLEVTKVGVFGSGYSLPYTIKSQLDGQNLNYIITNEPLTKITDHNAIETLTIDQRIQTIQYYDDLGRPIQTVKTQSSPGKNDVVQPLAYDEFGRQTTSYLPYADGRDGLYKVNALTSEAGGYAQSAQHEFYQRGGTLAADAKPYAINVLEESPMSRIQKSGNVGELWQPNDEPALDKTSKYYYQFNRADEILLFKYDKFTGTVNAGSGGLPRFYEANVLFANAILNENGHWTIEYSNTNGAMVCKKVQSNDEDLEARGVEFAATYYIYDDSGNLVVVLPPEAIRNSLDAFLK